MKKLFNISLLSVLLLSCEKNVEISPKTDFSGTVFIEGLLIAGEESRILVSQSVPFQDQKVTPQEVFARNAQVRITNQGVAETLQPDSLFDKFRCRWIPYYEGIRVVQMGESYDLEVVYDGKTYTASTTVSQPKVEIETIEYIEEFFDVYGGHDGVRITLPDVPGMSNYYRFQMNRKIDRSVSHAHVLDELSADCTGTDDFWTFDIGRTVYNDKGNDGGLLDFLAEVSFEYSEGDSTWVQIQSLDEKSAAFYQELDDQLISIVNPFVEPVFLKSTISGAAIGVFGSMVRSDSVLFIYPQDNP